MSLTFPCTAAQERLWFLVQLDPASPVYNVPCLFRFRGSLDEGALARALDAVVERHETLRTALVNVRGQPEQVVSEHVSLRLATTDLSHRPHAEDEARRLAREEAVRPFDVATAPLVRARLLRVREDLHHLVVVIHHVVFDAVSLEVLSRDLTALYAAFAASRPASLPELPIQYGDFAVWEHE